MVTSGAYTFVHWSGHCDGAGTKKTLKLYSNGEVSWEGGPLHGAWNQMDGNLYVEWHWNADETRTLEHVYKKIEGAPAWELVTRDGWQIPNHWHKHRCILLPKVDRFDMV
jgi:hypothetical protein